MESITTMVFQIIATTAIALFLYLAMPPLMGCSLTI